jgi:L-asparaginase
MKKILIIHTGGTFGMVPVEPHHNYAPGDIRSQILNYVPEIQNLANLHVMIPFNVDSSNIGIKQWDQLGLLIYEQMDNYDGFVVIHGTDTMVYTAAALSFTLRNLHKPVVITGAQRPLSRLRSDARSNLIDSIELATMDVPEVIIVFGQRILRGNCAKKISATRYDAFDTSNLAHLGEIGLNINLDTQRLLKPKGPLEQITGFSSKVAMFPVYPSIPAEDMYHLVESEKRVIIILAFGAGNLPGLDPDWIPFVKEAVDAGKAVFIGSQSGHGATDLELYECGRNALNAGAGQLGKMTHETAYVKLQKILTLSRDVKSVHKMFSENWAGEV